MAGGGTGGVAPLELAAAEPVAESELAAAEPVAESELAAAEPVAESRAEPVPIAV